MQIDPRMVQWDEAAPAAPTSPKIDPRMVKWEDEKPAKPAKADVSMSTILEPALNYSARDAIGGQVRGAGSFGATILAPFDAAEGFIARKMGAPELVPQNRRTSMDAGLQSFGVNTDSTQFKTNKLLTEVGGSAGVGKAVATGIANAAPRFAAQIPNLLSALQSGGMTAGAKTGLGAGATRVAGGAVAGGLTAGYVDPNDAKTGMLIGGLAPVAVQAAGSAGKFINDKVRNNLAERISDFNRKAPLNQTIRESLDAGYTIPPNMVNPSLKNQVIESVSGKQATQQIVSGKNEQVTGSLVRKSLGIADDVPLNTKALEDLRKTAGTAYAEVSSLSPTAAADLEALKIARNEASGWFKAYNRSASPDDLTKAKAARALSDQLEQALESHALSAGKKELIPKLRDARKLIAKTYTVSRAMNDASGTVDARVLGRMYEKGLPLSDGLDTAGRFASAFPTIAKSSSQVGSQGAHNLKAYGSLGASMAGGATMGPMGMLLGTVPFVAPPIARSIMFSQGAQRGLLQSAPQASSAAQLTGLLADPQLQQLVLRTAPVIGSR